MVWYSYLFKSFPQVAVIHIVKRFSVVNEIDIDVFLEFPDFSMTQHVINLISGSSAFPKLSLYIWKFSVPVLLTPCLKDFKHNLASMKANMRTAQIYGSLKIT